MSTKKKNPAAVALGRRSGVSLTPTERIERARRAATSRWSKAKPPAVSKPRWYGLVDVPPLPWNIYHNQDNDPGFAAWVEQIDKAMATSKGVIWFRDEAELDREVVRRRHLQDGLVLIIDGVNYDPAKSIITRTYKPDTGAQLNALEALLGTDEEQESQL